MLWEAQILLTSEAALTMFKLQRVFEGKNVPDSEAIF
jgi:hypothetical protein